MRILIRSQDNKTLMEPKILYIFSPTSSEIYNVYGRTDAGIIASLGTYETEERAIEVLNDITRYNNLIEKTLFMGKEESKFFAPVYYMPEK